MNSNLHLHHYVEPSRAIGVRVIEVLLKVVLISRSNHIWLEYIQQFSRNVYLFLIAHLKRTEILFVRTRFAVHGRENIYIRSR